jgi:two-component system CheB/CheR fusion protein
MRAPRPVGGDDAPRDGDGHRRQRTAAFETGPLPQLVVSGDGRLTLANAQARRLLRLNEADVGRPLRDLEVSYRPVELRSQIELAHQTQQEIVLRGVTLPVDGQELRLEVQIVPLDGADGEALGTSVTFNDVTRHRRLEDELNASRQALETAMEELQSTNEELETTNEELQSTNEELETVNEELQSTNEELETMNAELQSTNEALQAVNDEAERRAEERDRLTLYLGSIMESLRGGMLVVDRELKIEVWNRHAEDLWGLRSDEVVGHHLLSLDVGLPVDRLAGPLRACLAGSQESLDVEATTRRGRSIVCTVSCTPLADRAGEVTGAIVVMEEREGAL